MPSARNPERHTTRRTLTAAHKRAMADGRAMSATVDRYLIAINTPKRRGRKVNVATLEQRLALAQQRSTTASGLARAYVAQEVRDLKVSIARLSSVESVDRAGIETAFVEIAKAFGERRGITYPHGATPAYALTFCAEPECHEPADEAAFARRRAS